MTSCDGGNRNNDRDNNNSSVTLMLQRRIDQLSFHSFQQLVFLWLSYNRWHHIRPLGRHHRQGRRSVGGADYVADLPGHSSARVAVQLRHWHSPVSRRAVDELWGFMLRHGIPTGLVVTNSVFSERAQQAVAEYPGRPIQLVSRDRLSEWLRDSGLGVRRSWRGAVVDDRVFRTLERVGFASRLGRSWRKVDSEHGGMHVPVGDLRQGRNSSPSRLGRRSSLPGFLVAITVVLVLLWLIWLGAWR